MKPKPPGRQEERKKRSKRKIRTVLFIVLLLVLAAGAAYFLGGYALFGGRPPTEYLPSSNSPAVEEPADEEQAAKDEEQAAAGTPPEEEASGEESEENVYAGAMSTEVREDLADLPERVYVPNIIDGNMIVIDPKTFEIVDSYPVGDLPFHITPSWDMTELYVNNEQSGTLTAIDPETGRPAGTVPVSYPYNFYYTPDGETAIVVAERLQTVEFLDAETWEFLGSVYVPWPGVDHLDFSADGSYFLASSEWSGVVSKVDVNRMELVDYAEVDSLPIDVKLSPGGE